MRRKGHSGSEEEPDEVHDAIEAYSVRGGSGNQEGGDQQGGVQGERAGHPHNKVGLAKSGLLMRLARREAANKEYDIMGDMS